MAADETDSVGLRELRHRTGDVLARVQRGETIEVTDRGRLIARIVPVAERAPTPKLQRLLDSGRAQPAARPGTRPRMRTGDGTNRLNDTLRALRDDELW
jgi:prevent-host-death family protein